MASREDFRKFGQPPDGGYNQSWLRGAKALRILHDSTEPATRIIAAMLKSRLAIVGAFALGCSCTASSCRAAFTFLGPTPYLSTADSPFPIGSANFYLEDFEDDPNCVPGPGSFCGGGEFDAFGVRMIYGNTANGASVDADDGMIDGSGAAGASAIAVTVSGNPDLTIIFDAIEFEFDASVLGFLPTAVGFVLTDGAGDLSGLRVYDAAGAFADYDTTGIVLNPLTTSDDRFIGVVNPDGISRINFGKTTLASSGEYHPPRLDHLQYGLLIPEPSTATLAGVVFAASTILVRRLSRHPQNGVRHHVLEQTESASA